MFAWHTPCELPVMFPFAKNPVQGARAVGHRSYCSFNLGSRGEFSSGDRRNRTFDQARRQVQTTCGE